MSEAATIAQALGGYRNGEGWLCRCPVATHGKGRGDRKPSLSVHDGHTRVLVHCFTGCQTNAVMDELRRRGLVTTGHPPRLASFIREQSVTQSIAHEPDAHALSLWRSAVPIAGTLGETYLRGRGIQGQLPPSLRFLEAAEYLRGQVYLPAIVAGVQAPDRRVVAVQCTFIDPRGDRKAQVATPRRSTGALGAGAVRLAAATSALGLAEGIETALSAMQIHRVPVWACLGAGRMHRVEIPDTVTELHIFADADEPGLAAAERTAAAHRLCRVIIRSPPDGAKDWNDVVRRAFA